MYNPNLFIQKYHNTDISKYSFLITGGAGFIGSNLVEYLLKNDAGHVRVLDNLSNGYFQNIKDFNALSNFEFINGDIRNFEVCKNAVDGIDYISHQAALGSVPRSISDPFTTSEVNINGFLNMLIASKDSKNLKHFVYAASSSTYGDSKELPKVEGKEGVPLSPYAITKLVNELYADVFSKIYGFNSTGLRYFNVFGPKQNSNNPYAAVIPIFCKAFIEGHSLVINGDGETSRDFTFIENAVQANIKAMFSSNIKGHDVFNVACGSQTSLNEVVNSLRKISGKNVPVIFQEERKGDVKHSRANIQKIRNQLNYEPSISFSHGLSIVYDWYLNELLV
jgi:UDP-N-acetylglucosamine 4-epimerase